MDLIDTLQLTGLALVSGGIGAGLWQFIGAFGLIISGLTVIGGSVIAHDRG
jgi:hypothetical protein